MEVPVLTPKWGAFGTLLPLVLSILRAVEYAEDDNLVFASKRSIINDNIWQAADNPFKGARYAADVPDSGKLGQPFSGKSNTRDHLRRSGGVSIVDVVENFFDMVPRFRGVSQLHSPQSFQSAAISSSVAKVPLPSRMFRWIRATSSA